MSMINDDSILYHGATVEVREPLTNVGRSNKFLVEGLYKTKFFPEYNIEWLDFIAASRKQLKPWLGFDWIEGGIANDRVIATVDAYTDGYMTAEMAMDKLIKESLRHQVCILNQEIIDKYLTFVKSEGVI